MLLLLLLAVVAGDPSHYPAPGYCSAPAQCLAPVLCPAPYREPAPQCSLAPGTPGLCCHAHPAHQSCEHQIMTNRDTFT